MSRINHNRPQLRYSDNFSRELRNIGILVGDSRSSSHKDVQGYQEPTVYSKPPVEFPGPAINAMAAFLTACENVIEREIAAIGNANPNNKVQKKIIDAAETDRHSARVAQDSTADELLIVVAQMCRADVKDFSRWLKWLEGEAIKNNSLTILDVIFEYGIKPAFARALK